MKDLKITSLPTASRSHEFTLTVYTVGPKSSSYVKTKYFENGEFFTRRNDWEDGLDAEMPSAVKPTCNVLPYDSLGHDADWPDAFFVTGPKDSSSSLESTFDMIDYEYPDVQILVPWPLRSSARGRDNVKAVRRGTGCRALSNNDYFVREEDGSIRVVDPVVLTSRDRSDYGLYWSTSLCQMFRVVHPIDAPNAPDVEEDGWDQMEDHIFVPSEEC